MTETTLPGRSARKRQTILSAGQALFLSNGYQGTSMDQVAASAAVSKQTVYKHFGEKQELLFAIVNECAGQCRRPHSGPDLRVGREHRPGDRSGRTGR